MSDCCWSGDHLSDRSQRLQDFSPVPLLQDIPDQVSPNVGICVRRSFHMLERRWRVRCCLPVHATGQDLGAVGGRVLHQHFPCAATRLSSQYLVRHRHFVPAASPRPSAQDQLDAEDIPRLHVHAGILCRVYEHLPLHGIPWVQPKRHSLHVGCSCGVECHRDQ